MNDRSRDHPEELLHPERAFGHPSEGIKDPDLTINERRALENLSQEVCECVRHAEDCAERAKREPNPTIERDFLDMERRWLRLARSYQFAAQLKRFFQAPRGHA
jgi:hypothetical protein